MCHMILNALVFTASTTVTFLNIINLITPIFIIKKNYLKTMFLI